MNKNLRLSGLLSYFLFIVMGLVLAFASCEFSGKDNGHPRYFDTVFNISTQLTDMGKVKSAFAIVDSAYNAFPQATKRDLCRKYSWKANTYHFIAEYSTALIYADSLLDLIGENKAAYKSEYAGALSSKGRALLKLSDYNKAFQCFYGEKLFVQRYMDTCDFALYIGNLTSVLYLQGKYREAIKYMQEDYDNGTKCGKDDFGSSFVNRQGALDNMGLCYENMGIYDTAIIYYNSALDFIADNEGRYPNEKETIAICLAVINGNLGNVYLKTGQLKEAEELFRKNIAANDLRGYSTQDSRLTKMKLSRLFMQQGKFVEARKLIEEEREYLNRKPNTDEERLFRKLRWHYYDTLGDIPNAYLSYKSYVSFNDSLDAKTKELPGADFNKTFTQLYQQDEITALKKESEFKNYYLLVALIVAIMAAIIIYLVWRNYRESKKNLLSLTRLNRQVNGQNITLQKTLNALENSQQDNTRMMKVVAHDLHNPIAAMVSLTDLLRDGNFTEEQQEMFQMLATSGNNALKLIDSMLHAKPAMDMELLHLDELVTYSVGLMQYRAKVKRQSLVLNVEPVAVLADREKMWRVINNLIVNAIKFSYEGKSIYITLMKRDGKALLSVKDEGVGIPSSMKGEIFHLFALEGRTGTSGEESFGLGLSISKQIVDAHNGKIWFESEQGKGTTFFVELPMTEAPGNEE